MGDILDLPSPRVHLVFRRGAVTMRVSTSAISATGIGYKLGVWKILLPPVAQFYLQSRDWHGGVTATSWVQRLSLFSKGHHLTRADGSDRQRGCREPAPPRPAGARGEK